MAIAQQTAGAANVVSEIRRGRDAHVRAWVEAVEDVELHLSVMTLGEIRKGIELLGRRDPSQAEVFARWLDGLHARFAERIVAIDARIAEEWGRLNAAATRRTAPPADLLVSAQASRG
jgi:predicted nucleic acid-binding protein